MPTPSTPETFTTQEELNALILDVLPKQGQWSDEDYLWLTDSLNRLIEFTDGYIELLPWPTEQHQSHVAFLLSALDTFIRPAGGVVRFVLMRLRLRAGKFREPDLLLLRDAKDPRRANRYWDWADLVVEIASPDKPERDLVEKRRDYAEAHIPEYWIVNPLDETITVLQLHEGVYIEHGVFRRGAQATSVLLPGFSVEVTALFDAV